MPKTVLTVDDSASVRLMVGFTLSGLGLEVIEAENGAQALTVLAARKVDLILADVNMPEMDGIEMLKRLKADPKTKDIPVVMLSTESGKDASPEAAGARRWLTKPFGPEQLAQVVKENIG